MQNHHVIYYNRPAGSWQEACLTGNGHFGAAVCGQPGKEEILLSHNTFFSGSDGEDPYREGAADAFSRARQAAVSGDYEKMSEEIDHFIGEKGNYGTSLPVGKILIRSMRPVPALFYQRSLDLENGIVGVSFDTPMGRQEREAFCSHPDRVFACHFQEQDPKGMSVRIRFDGGRNPFDSEINGDCLLFHVSAKESVHSDGKEGTALWGLLMVSAPAGTVRGEKDALIVENAPEFTVYLSMETDYSLEGKKKPEEALMKDRLVRAAADYELLKKRHKEDFSSLMGRVSLSLCPDKKEEGTEEDGQDPDLASLLYIPWLKLSGQKKMEMSAQEMMEQVRGGLDNRALTELMFQFGRYLLVSSSREDSELPASLQGIWNDDVACQIGWTCDMHLDINTQMNYWISGPGNLSETRKPLFRWMEKRLIPMGRKTARMCYGLPGWAAELVSNAWGYAAPYRSRVLAPCPTCGIWMASDYMEYFRFTKDEDFLKEHAWPIFDEAVDFFLAYLFRDPEGRLCSGPSISPENAFLSDEKKEYASLNPAFEVTMIRELFLDYLEAARILGKEDEKTQKVSAFLSELSPLKILEDGTIAEWEHGLCAADPQHRHTSHLLGLFPYHQISPEKTPELAEAAEKTIQKKLTPYEGWEDTGWARTMLGLYEAREQNGQKAFAHLLSMQMLLTGPGLLVMHPPTRGAASFADVYEMDGNTGFSMIVSEMLLQSEEGKLKLLPALPKAWPEGSFCGACICGGMTVDLTWKDGKAESCRIFAKTPCSLEIAMEGKRIQAELAAGENKIF